uniref:Uncharacterized protein n=1 Tax=Globisporangium ultimum (strain ATCC 200006 / CBS 805.95 / DAOM BR144) TaxID=431595 RepID=K3XC57_GLOUD
MASMVTPRPQFPPGHPMHGQPPTEEEERSRKRRVRIFQFVISMAALACAYKFFRWIASFKSAGRKALVAPPAPSMNRNLERIFQNTAVRNRALLH